MDVDCYCFGGTFVCRMANEIVNVVDEINFAELVLVFVRIEVV